MLEINKGETMILLNILYVLRTNIIKYKYENKTEIDNDKNFEFTSFESLINNIICKLEKNISYYDYYYECENSDIKRLLEIYRKVIED